MCVCSHEEAAAGRALLAAQDAVLAGSQGLNQGPEVLEGDALALTNAHLMQDFPEALLCPEALWTRRHKQGHVPSAGLHTDVLLEF